MTQEEKAKAYDEALKRAKILYNDKNEIGYANAESVLEEVFPLLKESKDERIRKEIINYFAKGKEYLSLCSIGKDDILAWLEKQGSPKSAPMQNGIIINGVEYELIKDDEADECDRCALKDQCDTNGEELLCTPIFGYDIMSFHRFEKRK